jgi:hypothetical protein
MRTFLLCIALALTLVSCSTKRTIVTSQGTMTVETNAMHNTVKVSNASGTAIIGKGAVNEAALGLPLYPGAIASDTGGMAVHNTSGTSDVVSLTTTDSFDKVYTWYKQRMPNGTEQTHMMAAGGSVASFEEGKLGDKDQKSVVITESGGKTTILLTHAKNS